MKAFIVLAVLVTLGIIWLFYRRSRDMKKLFIALATFGVIVSLAVLGNVTRQIMPIYMAHIILVLLSWGGLIVYLLKGRYYWWIIFSPVITIGVFLLLEFLTGSGHEAG